MILNWRAFDSVEERIRKKKRARPTPALGWRDLSFTRPFVDVPQRLPLFRSNTAIKLVCFSTNPLQHQNACFCPMLLVWNKIRESHPVRESKEKYKNQQNTRPAGPATPQNCQMVQDSLTKILLLKFFKCWSKIWFLKFWTWSIDSQVLKLPFDDKVLDLEMGMEDILGTFTSWRRPQLNFTVPHHSCQPSVKQSMADKLAIDIMKRAEIRKRKIKG